MDQQQLQEETTPANITFYITSFPAYSTITPSNTSTTFYFTSTFYITSTTPPSTFYTTPITTLSPTTPLPLFLLPPPHPLPSSFQEEVVSIVTVSFKTSALQSLKDVLSRDSRMTLPRTPEGYDKALMDYHQHYSVLQTSGSWVKVEGEGPLYTNRPPCVTTQTEN